MADERDTATEARDSASLRTEARLAEAQEVHDTVVQGLTVAKYALERGDAEAASQAIMDTLSRARDIITGLLDDTELLPGDLRRATPALGDEPRGDGGS
jgi:signal transduction histidine kinase